MKEEKVQYPLLWINNYDSTFGVFRDKEELTTCTKGAINGFYKQIELIAINGNCFKIREAKKIKTIAPYSLSTLLWRLVGGEKIEVKLVFDKNVIQCTPKSLKEEVLKIFNLNEERWDSDGRLNELKRLLGKSTTAKGIILLLEKRYFGESF